MRSILRTVYFLSVYFSHLMTGEAILPPRGRNLHFLILFYFPANLEFFNVSRTHINICRGVNRPDFISACIQCT
jgi:hypothetical protein